MTGVSKRNSLRLAFLISTAAVAMVGGEARSQTTRAAAAETQANAQGAPALPADATAEAATVGDIIVTARRRAERIIDVPVAITALDSAALARYSTSDFTNLGKQVPQLMITRSASGNGASVTIRGVDRKSVV